MTSFQRVQLQDGGGNILPKDRISVRRVAAIGDCVAASVVADKLKEQEIPTDFQCHSMIVPILRRCRSIDNVLLPSMETDVNLDQVYEKDPERKTKHFHDYFVGAANRQLRARGIDLGPAVNCRPHLVVTHPEQSLAQTALASHPRPWVFVCPRSQWFRCRDVPDFVWEAAAKEIVGTKFWIGMNPPPTGFVDLRCGNIDQVCVMLSAADLLISTDTGPAHLAIALGIQTLLIGQSSDPVLHFSDLCDFEVIYPPLECLNCQANQCAINKFVPPCQNIEPGLIAQAANRKLRRNIVSCVIPTLSAPAERLNRCINAVLNQVDEIVVTADAGGKFPKGSRLHPKIRYVQSRRHGLGFGKNVNYGVRHTSGSQVLILNDDAFLDPDCVKRLMEQVRPDVGLVGHLLRYENGRIYFAGRQRRNGERGFPHINHNEFHPTFQEPVEQEAVSATSLLMNRKAFYGARCFNERFSMYAEDDALSLQVRSKGYKIIFTPHATGTHQGQATTNTTGQFYDWMAESGKLMEQLWGPYWDWNRSKVPGDFSYLKS